VTTVARDEDAVPKPAEAKPVADAEVQPNAIVGFAPSYSYRAALAITTATYVSASKCLARLCAGHPRLWAMKDVDGRDKPSHDG
jgi:hypothetical protein